MSDVSISSSDYKPVEKQLKKWKFLLENDVKSVTVLHKIICVQMSNKEQNDARKEVSSSHCWLTDNVRFIIFVLFLVIVKVVTW